MSTQRRAKKEHRIFDYHSLFLFSRARSSATSAASFLLSSSDLASMPLVSDSSSSATESMPLVSEFRQQYHCIIIIFSIISTNVTHITHHLIVFFIHYNIIFVFKYGFFGCGIFLPVKKNTKHSDH